MQVFNFCAGPAMLPQAVMEKAQKELLNWQELGCSVMELSHRAKPYLAMVEQAEADLRELMQIPDNYAVLFLHGGGRGQFSAVPLNIAQQGKKAAYLMSGSWSDIGSAEAEKYTPIERIELREKNAQGVVSLKPATVPAGDFSYVHYCPNETVDGIQIFDEPQTELPLVADMSSCILSREIDVSKYGVIYAGAQKNIGPSGLAIAIVRRDLLDRASPQTPCIMSYKLAAENMSMYNTPPTFSIYLAAEVFKWLKAEGGVQEMARRNREKASLLYDFIDNSAFYENRVAQECRSEMNVPFLLQDESLNQTFLDEAQAAGLLALEGHRSVGGMRASIYNAMPIEGVKALITFMQAFADKHAK